MKRLIMTLFFGFLSSVSFAQDLEIGHLAVAGAGCFNNDNSEVYFEDDVLVIKTQVMVKKAADKTVARGACTFALPITLAPGKKLVLAHASLLGELNLGTQSKLNVRDELFFVGEEGHLIQQQETTQSRRLKKKIILGEDIALASTCGGSSILRGNSSLTIAGEGARSTARLDGIYLVAFVEDCE